MNPELQRVKIAEAVGWTNVRRATILKGRIMREDVWGCPPEWEKNGYTTNEVTPDYLNSLDSCAEMERVLNEDQAILYRHRLAMNSDGGNAPFLTVEAAMCHATAPQRCEAFLRVMGLWQDS